MMGNQMRTLLSFCMMLLVALASPLARAADPPATPGITTLVPGLPNPRLLGLEKGYLYWVELPFDADGPANDVIERLRRVKKEGGTPELVAQLEGAEVASDCGVASAGDDLLFVLHARETGDDRVGRIVAVGKPGAALVPRTSDRAGLCDVFIHDGRLWWTEDSGLWSAKLDGSGAKQLWSTPANATIRRVAVRDQNLIVFLATGEARPEEQGLGSFGTIGHGRHGGARESGGQAVQIPPTGKATVLWRGRQLLHSGAVDGADLLVCEEDGLVRVPKNGKTAKHISDTCLGVHRWNGWQLDWRVGVPSKGPLTAISLVSPARLVEVLPKMFGFAGAILSDADAPYVCAGGKKQELCDLVRLPGPDWFEHLPTVPPAH